MTATEAIILSVSSVFQRL